MGQWLRKVLTQEDLSSVSGTRLIAGPGNPSPEEEASWLSRMVSF